MHKHSNDDETPLERLRQFLDAKGAGEQDAEAVDDFLFDCWALLDMQDDSRLIPRKLLNRLEKVCWEPPILRFQIVRHGGTVLGSTRGEVHAWTVNLDSREALYSTVGQRQLRPRQASFKADSVAKDLASLIKSGKEDPRLLWYGPNEVKVLVEKIVPSEGNFKQTVAGRRKRLRDAVRQRLATQGFCESVKPWSFRQEVRGTIPSGGARSRRKEDERPSGDWQESR